MRARGFGVAGVQVGEGGCRSACAAPIRSAKRLGFSVRARVPDRAPGVSGPWCEDSRVGWLKVCWCWGWRLGLWESACAARAPSHSLFLRLRLQTALLLAMAWHGDGVASPATHGWLSGADWLRCTAQVKHETLQNFLSPVALELPRWQARLPGHSPSPLCPVYMSSPDRQ